jgi:NAD(P)H-hydrate epimerase
MIKIPGIPQLRALDAQTIELEDIASLDLMERAARAVTTVIAERWPATTPIVIFAGPGNNGGDALAVARQLGSCGYQVEAYLFNTTGTLSNDCQENKKRLVTSPNVKFTEVKESFEPPHLKPGALLIDGLFGTGLNKPLSGGFALLARFMNEAAADVIAIDVPSGVLCESLSSDAGGVIVQARLTLTFQFPKLPMLLAGTARYFGEVKVLDIGLARDAIARMECDSFVYRRDDVRSLLLPRDAFGHKGTFGHALIIAGRYGMAGAALFCGRGALRSGCGKITIHSPQMNNDILQATLPEAILSHDPADTVVTAAVKADSYDAVAIGPGLGTDIATAKAFMEQISKTRQPLVIDADGLNILSEHSGWLSQLPRNTILTPHVGEMQRLLHHRVDDVALLAATRTMAINYGLYIVLKGHHTVVCTPEGRLFFNTTGNSGMATAGSGDVLTGVIVSLLAQHYAPQEACLVGVHLHGLAGDIAAERLSEEGLVASDIVAALPAAFRQLRGA